MGILKQREETSWVTYVKYRIKKNKNALLFISGPTGSGKSYSSLSIAEQIDKEFDITHVVFSGVELMDLINGDKLHKGSVIVFEEMGVEMSNKNWMSVTNKMINYLMQTFRHRCFVLIMNSPYMDFVDASTRKLFHAEISTQGIDFKRKITILKPQLIQYNARNKKFYYKYLRMKKGKGIAPVERWHVPKPSKKLLEAYEIRKREYTDKLNKRIQTELEEAQPKPKVTKKLTERQKEVLKGLQNKMTVSEIGFRMNKSGAYVHRIMHEMQKKGYKFNPKWIMKEGDRKVIYDITKEEKSLN